MKKINEISILGFGNQAKAWALNLRDSGIKVSIGLRPGSTSIALAKKLGFQVFADTRIPTKFAALLTPDHTHKSVLEYYNPTEKTIILAHGYSQLTDHLCEKFPHNQFVLLAPKAIASELRLRYETEKPLTAFYSLENAPDVDWPSLEDLAGNIGLGHLFPTTFKEETEADLFSEQSLLCSTLPYAINQTFQTLMDKGFSKEIAFFECFFETKLILDTIMAKGPQAFFDMISPNALIGAEKGREMLFDVSFKQKLDQLLREIQNEEFFKTVEQTNFDELKTQVNNYWTQQTLNQTYSDLRDTL